MSQNEVLEIEVVVGEDFAAQIVWTDEDGAAVPVVAPCRLEVRDMGNALVIQFDTASAGSATTKAALVLTGSDGVMQISAPRTITTGLKAGRYLFDLFAVTSPSPAPFASQEVQVASAAGSSSAPASRSWRWPRYERTKHSQAAHRRGAAGPHRACCAAPARWGRPVPASPGRPARSVPPAPPARSGTPPAGRR